MNIFKTLAMVGLVGFGMVYGEDEKDSVSNQPLPPKISYECFVIASDSPIQHDFSKITNQSKIFIYTLHKTVTSVGKETNLWGCPSSSPEYTIGLTNPMSIRTGISIALTGTLEQGRIRLIGKMISTETDAPKSFPERFTLESKSSALYFSTITKSGFEIWFNMDRMLLKIPLMGEHSSYRYHTLRIVPTLIP